jgi:hypothetical protein
LRPSIDRSATVFTVLQLPIRLLENLVVRKVSPQRQLTALW